MAASPTSLKHNKRRVEIRARGKNTGVKEKSRDKQRRHRQRIRRNEELYNLYKIREAMRMREYRLKKKDVETEDVKQKRREAAKLRQRKRRALLKQQGFNVKVEVTDDIIEQIQTTESNDLMERQRQYWRQKKQESRNRKQYAGMNMGGLLYDSPVCDLGTNTSTETS